MQFITDLRAVTTCLARFSPICLPSTSEVYPQKAAALLASRVQVTVKRKGHVHKTDKAIVSHEHETRVAFSDNSQLRPQDGNNVKDECKQLNSIMTALSKMKGERLLYFGTFDVLVFVLFF